MERRFRSVVGNCAGIDFEVDITSLPGLNGPARILVLIVSMFTYSSNGMDGGSEAGSDTIK